LTQNLEISFAMYTGTVLTLFKTECTDCDSKQTIIGKDVTNEVTKISFFDSLLLIIVSTSVSESKL